MILSASSKTHWNYYLAIEEDLIKTARFVEFNNDNLKTYSIEFARILLAASSEVDVILKLICKQSGSKKKEDNINKYRITITEIDHDFATEFVYINRYGLKFQPWLNWINDTNPPNWWTSYNKVKHKRDIAFSQANLQNTLNAVGGLHIAVLYYYKHLFLKETDSTNIKMKDVTRQLLPKSSLITLNEDYYHGYLIL